MAQMTEDVERKIVQELVNNDPEFIKLTPEQQDSVISRIYQDEYGVIPNTENLLQRAINDSYASLYNFANTASFGAVDKAREFDNALFDRDRPAPHASTGLGKIAEFGSGVAGFMAGGPGKISAKVASSVLPKAAAKRTLPGFIARSVSRAAEGAVSGASMPGNLEERKIAAGIGAIIGPATGAVGDTFFARQAGLARKKEVGRMLGERVARMSEFGVEGASTQTIANDIDDLLNRFPFEEGAVRTGLGELRDKLVGFGNRNLSIDEMVQLEQQLGRVGIYKDPITGILKHQGEITPRLNMGAKSITNAVSEGVENRAGSIGIRDYGELSGEYSNLIKKFPNKKQSTFGKAMKTGLAFLGLGGGGQAASLAALGEMALENPTLKNKLFEFITSQSGKSLGRASTGYAASNLSKNRL